MKRHHLLLLLILTSFLLLSSAIAFQQRAIWWDSAVYVGIGKYYWSQGEFGLMEQARAPLLPLILGFYWKLGLDAVIFGAITALLFSLGTIYFTFRLGERISDTETGLLAAFLTAFSFTVLFFSRHMLTEIPSTFFLLLGIYFLLSKKPIMGGTMLALSFLMRFFQLLPIVIVAVCFFLYWRKGLFWKVGNPMLRLIAGFALPLAPYLIFVSLAYGDALFPFTLQHYLSTHTGAIYSQPWWFYFFGLAKENFLLLSLVALPLALKRKKNLQVIAFAALIPLLAYSLIAHKEMRLILPILPLIFLLAASSTLYLFRRLGKQSASVSKTWLFALCGIFLAINLFFVVPLVVQQGSPGSYQELFFQNYLQNLGHRDERVWVSSPLYSLYADVRIDGLAYYPFIIGEPDLALINTCDFFGNDEEYMRMIQNTMEKITMKLSPITSSAEGGCVYTIYR